MQRRHFVHGDYSGVAAANKREDLDLFTEYLVPVLNPGSALRTVHITRATH